MATLLEELARQRAQQRRSGVTFMPPVRPPAPARRPAAPPPRGVRQPVSEGSLTDRLIANHSGAAMRLAQTQQPQEEGGGLSGLGWLVGKPLQAGLSALSVLDYPRATVNALVSEIVPEIIQRMPDAGDYPALDTDFSWGDIGRNIKERKGFGETLVEPVFGPEGGDWNIWVRRGLGLAGDIATDPFSYATMGTKALMGAPARAEYANKLLDVTQGVERGIARNQDVIARLAPMMEQAAKTPPTGYGAWAQQAMGKTLGEAERTLPELVARQERLLARPPGRSELDVIEQIGRRGVNVANPEQLAAMGIAPHAVRWGGVALPGTERISRAATRVTAPLKERITSSLPATKLRSLRTPTGEAGQELGRAMERILTGRGDISMERALRTIKLDQWIREGGSTFRAFAARALQQLDDEVADMPGEERAALLWAAERGEDNVVKQMGPRMIEAAREAGVELPVIEGMEYVPHVLSREAFNFLDRMRAGKNPLVDEFRRRIGITSDDLLEEGGFLQRRSFRPELQADGTLKPQKFKIGDQEIEIVTGTVDELEEKLGGVLRSAGFEGKLYETDPVEAWKRYIISTERDVGKRYSARRGARAGYEGLFERPKGTLGPEGYDPVGFKDLLPREPGGPTRRMAYRKPESAEPKGDDLFEYVENEAETLKRNQELAKKKPRPKNQQGLTQREIAEEYETLGNAERRAVAERIDETAGEMWNPHRDEMKELKKAQREARDQIADAARQGQVQAVELDRLDAAIAEADKEIASLQRRIGGLTAQGRRRVEVQSEMLLGGLREELEAATREREQMMDYLQAAIERSKTAVPAAKRRAAVREWLSPARRERKLRGALENAKKKAKADRVWAEKYLKGAAINQKTGKSNWITAEAAKSAEARLDDPKLQRAYNALVEERNNIAQARLRLMDEAVQHENRAQEALAKANLAETSDDEVERLTEVAKQQRKLANQKARDAAEMLGAHNTVVDKISKHQLTKDRATLRLRDKQQKQVDAFSQDIGLGNRVDVALAERQQHEAELALRDFERQKANEAAYQANPPPRTLTEHYERELPKAERVIESPEARTLAENRKRLRQVREELKENPRPTMRDVEVPEAKWTKTKAPVEAAPPPAVAAAATVAEEIPTLSRSHMGLLYLMKTKGDVQIATTADAKRLVDLGLVERTELKPRGFTGNIGNSKRWKLTAKGKEYAKRIDLENGKYTLAPVEAAAVEAAPKAVAATVPSSWTMKTGEGELDRYVIQRVITPYDEPPKAFGEQDYWAITYPGEDAPKRARKTMREAQQEVARDREWQALGEKTREWKQRTESLQTEYQQLTEWLDSNRVFGETVEQAETTARRAGEHTARQFEIEQAQKIVDEQGDVLNKLNAKADLEEALKTPEPVWDPEAMKRAEFDALHAEWAQQQAAARKQLRVVKGQLTKLGDRVELVQVARRKLNELEAVAAREFENVPKLERPPYYAGVAEEGERKIAEAGSLASQLEGVARKWEPQAARAVQEEMDAASRLARATGSPGPMRTIGEPGYKKPKTITARAEETAEGIPTTVEGIVMQAARGNEQGLQGVMPEIASARQRIEEIHAGKQLNLADREVVEEAQSAWFAPYNQGIENQRVARARYAEIEGRAAGLKQPRSAMSIVEGQRGGRPYGSQLELVEGGVAPKKAQPGGLAALKGTPAYEAQPVYRTIEDLNKVIAANPTGDDALVNRIEAEVGNHLTQLDRITREYDIPARALNGIIKEANNGKLAPVLKRQLKEGFEYMWEGGDIIIDKELKAIYFNVSKQLDSKLFGRTFTMLTDFFKTYATLTPGFHVRNALSAIFMNSSEGVGMATQRDAVRLWRQFVEAEDAVVWMRALRKTDPKAAEAFRAVFASGAGGQFMERGVSELRAGGTRMSERVFANKVTRLSQRIGSGWVEGPQRLALALDSTRQGMTITDAINRVTRVHFDYGQVSRFDEKAKRIIPFWTFMSRNVPLQFTQMWAKPRTYLRYQSFVRNMTMGVEEDPWIPEYIKQGGGFDTGIRTPGWLTNSPLASIPVLGNLVPPEGMPVVLQPDLPHTRLQEDVRRTAAALGGDNTGQILSDVNPFFTAPFEYAMGKDFFTGKTYDEDDWSQTSGLGSPLAMLLSPVGGGKRGANGEWYLQDKAMNLLRSLVPPIDRTARLTPGLLEEEPENMDRMLESYVRFLGGPVRTISEEQKRDEAARRYYDQLDAARLAAATGGR